MLTGKPHVERNFRTGYFPTKVPIELLLELLLELLGFLLEFYRNSIDF